MSTKNVSKTPYSAIAIGLTPNLKTGGLLAEVLTVSEEGGREQVDRVFLDYDPSTQKIDWASISEETRLGFSDAIDQAVDGYFKNDAQLLNNRLKWVVPERDDKITNAGCISFVGGRTEFSIWDINKTTRDGETELSVGLNNSGFLPEQTYNDDYSFFKDQADFFMDDYESVSDFTLTIIDSDDTPFNKIQSPIFEGAYEPFERLARVSCTKDSKSYNLDVYFTPDMDMTFIQVPSDGLKKYIDELISNKYTIYNSPPGVYENLSLTVRGQDSSVLHLMAENVLHQHGLDSYDKIKYQEPTGKELRQFTNEFYEYLAENHLEKLAEYKLYNSLVNLSHGVRDANPGESQWIPVAESFASNPYASGMDLRGAWDEFQVMQKAAEASVEQRPSQLQAAHQAVRQAASDQGLDRPTGNPVTAAGEPADLCVPAEIKDLIDIPKQKHEKSPSIGL